MFMPKIRIPWWKRLLWKLRILKRPSIPPFEKFVVPLIRKPWPSFESIVIGKGSVKDIPAKVREEIGEDTLERLNK